MGLAGQICGNILQWWATTICPIVPVGTILPASNLPTWLRRFLRPKYMVVSPAGQNPAFCCSWDGRRWSPAAGRWSERGQPLALCDGPMLLETWRPNDLQQKRGVSEGDLSGLTAGALGIPHLASGPRPDRRVALRSTTAVGLMHPPSRRCWPRAHWVGRCCGWFGWGRRCPAGSAVRRHAAPACCQVMVRRLPGVVDARQGRPSACMLRAASGGCQEH